MKTEKMTQILTRCMIMLCALMSLMPLAQAQTPSAPKLTITDNNKPHAAIIRFAQFATTLTANVSNAPETTTEATIDGPTWEWKGGTDAVKLTSLSGSASSGLDSGFPPHYGGKKGIYPVPVSCTATYTKTIIKTGAKSTIPVTGSLTVEFFIRVPEIVFGTAPRANTIYTGDSIYAEDRKRDVYIYGHLSLYALQIKDNQDKNPDVGHREPYGYGLPHEEFSSFPLNGSQGGSTWNLDLASGMGGPTANFVDGIGFTTYENNPMPDNSWLDNLRGATDQFWSCVELPPYINPQIYVPPGSFGPGHNPTVGDFSPPVEVSGLGAHHVVDYWGYAIRTAATYPYVDTPVSIDGTPRP